MVKKKLAERETQALPSRSNAMSLKHGWPFPDLQKPQILFNLRSKFVVPLVGTFSKIVIGWLNKLEVHNVEVFQNLIASKRTSSLITVSNHFSCLDDPGLWGVRSLAADFKLFTAPLQMELQCNDELKAKFRTSSPLSFFHNLVFSSSNFPKYIAPVQRIMAMFGSTYCCEQLSKTRSLTFAPNSQTATSMTFFCCLPHPSSQTLKHFFMASSTIRLTDLWRDVWSATRMRWSLAAHDICFTSALHSWFFSSGKCVPIIRGIGVYQQGMDFCLERLNEGSWVHIFPEGKVNMTLEHMRLKWGVGRLIYESLTPPIVLPLYHVGMEAVLPNYPPYIPRVLKKVTVVVGNPIDFSGVLSKLSTNMHDGMTARKLITDVIQEDLRKLRSKAEMLHKRRLELS